MDDNPYHRLHLEGHDHAVRALAARGRTLVSGSYDCTVRIWDIITGACKWVLVGHTQKGQSSIHPVYHSDFPLTRSHLVYSVVLDNHRNLACSGSMDGTVRVWNLRDGTCQHTLTGHTSLVGLLGLSPSYLVSAAADSTLRVWDPETGELRHTLAAHNGAITCFQHDEFKVLSGSDGTLKMWDIRDGTQVRDLLTGIVGVWQVIFEGRWCVAASNRGDSTGLDVWDFGLDGVDDEWEGEPPGGIYDEDTDDEDEADQAEVDAMDQDLDMEPSDSDEADNQDQKFGIIDIDDHSTGTHSPQPPTSASTSAIISALPRAPYVFKAPGEGSDAGPSAAGAASRPLPSNDETPTRPRIRSVISKRPR